MFVTFKKAPELGRLRVVSDFYRKNPMLTSCGNCALHIARYVEVCYLAKCGLRMVHFVKVNPNET